MDRRGFLGSLFSGIALWSKPNLKAPGFVEVSQEEFQSITKLFGVEKGTEPGKLQGVELRIVAPRSPRSKALDHAMWKPFRFVGPAFTVGPEHSKTP